MRTQIQRGAILSAIFPHSFATLVEFPKMVGKVVPGLKLRPGALKTLLQLVEDFAEVPGAGFVVQPLGGADRA